MGPGLLESVYQECMIKELTRRSISIEEQVTVPLFYDNEMLQKEYEMDLLVEGEIILELKAVEIVDAVHHAQLISYLKLADKRMGFLINFNVPLLKHGFKRFVNNY